MTGPRHLGHYFSTMIDWPRLQKQHRLIIVIDDVIALQLYPNSRKELAQRTMQVAKEFMATGIDLTENQIVLTSMLPEAHELFVYAMMYFGHSLCESLYRETFPAMLTSFQRQELGLPTQPSTAEVVYPQVCLASLTLGLHAAFFQGGEEMKGYLLPMKILSENFGRQSGFKVPRLLPGQSTFVPGTDGEHMGTENAIYVSASETELRADVRRVSSPTVLSAWASLFGGDDKRVRLSYQEKTNFNELGELIADYLVREFTKFRNSKITESAIGDCLETAAKKIREELAGSLGSLKKGWGLAGY